uniref:Pentatricopeptide repeat-containing protein n=1 Tax=Zea mays TaxID=4577 RepID=A0A804LQA2_MAIZE
MALALLSPSTPSHRILLRPIPFPSLPVARATSAGSFGLAFFCPLSRGSSSLQRTGAAGGVIDSAGEGSSEEPVAGWLSADLLRRISGAADADRVLDIVAESVEGAGAALGAPECNAIVSAAFDRGNIALALSVFEAMRSGFAGVGGWRWARPDVRTYALLVQRLAAAPRVADAIMIIDYVSRAGASSMDEVPFGIIVRCPTCMIAVAVVQPQDGTQTSAHSWNSQDGRLEAGLFPVQSVDINMNYFLETLRVLNPKKLGSPPAERSMDISALEKALRFINMRKDGIPAAVHSIVIRSPSGTARTYRFATQNVTLPAQEGERVTISLAAPVNVYRDMGPLKVAARSQGFKPGEPMCLTNHINGQVSKLLRAPSKNKGTFFLSPYLLVGALAFLASTDAASAFIDPSLPRLVTATAIASAAIGTTLNGVVLPKIQKLPEKAVDIVAVQQKLLSQYDILQSRLKELKQFAQKEVWMLARMCQLDNKIVAVGEPSYR